MDEKEKQPSNRERIERLEEEAARRKAVTDQMWEAIEDLRKVDDRQERGLSQLSHEIGSHINGSADRFKYNERTCLFLGLAVGALAIATIVTSILR